MGKQINILLVLINITGVFIRPPKMKLSVDMFPAHRNGALCLVIRNGRRYYQKKIMRNLTPAIIRRIVVLMMAEPGERAARVVMVAE
ncbi:hypothetical protein DOQ41_10740, partial [Salmonella enterica subsp. enterica serovar Kottbus]|nr:hypothetical protein [Salmonella enterica subsp. enterica serovar Kottbus]